MIHQTNIIREWLALRGGSKADAVRWLNATLDRKYQQSRLLQWEKLEQPIPQIVLRAILPEVLPTILRANGVTPTPQIIEAVEWAAGLLPDTEK